MKPRTHGGDVCWQVRHEFPHDNDVADEFTTPLPQVADRMRIGFTLWFAVASSRGRSALRAKLCLKSGWAAGASHSMTNSASNPILSQRATNSAMEFTITGTTRTEWPSRQKRTHQRNM